MMLVTGATGHIGNVIVRQLLERGEKVRVLVRPGKLPAALAGLNVEITHGDILDKTSLENALIGVSLVYHLAAHISLSARAGPVTQRTNLEGTLNLLEVMRRSGTARLVYASSVYALRRPVNGRPIDETQPFDELECQGAYDCSKARASLAVQKAVAEGLDAVILCPSAVTGPYDFHDSEAGRAIRLYMRPGLKFYVEGAYDFVDVRDVAQGFILAAEKGSTGETYILSGERLSVREVAQMIGEATRVWHAGIKIPLGLAYWIADRVETFSELSGVKPFFTRYSLDAICSNSKISHAKASRELGFQPRPAREAILEAVRWFQQRQVEAPANAERTPKAAV
jgi:dihydroflavonol-4-reductase